MCAASSDPVRGGRRIAAALLWLAWLASLAALAVEAELRVIPLKHRMADEVVPVLRPLLAPGESLTGMDTRLIVRAGPRSLAQIERVLGEIDVPRRNLRISVRHGSEREVLRQDQGLSGELRNGTTRIIVSGDRAAGGLTAGASGPRGSVTARSERRITTTHDTSSQTLTVLDGARGFLRVGESIPQVQPFLALAGPKLGVVTGIQYYDVTTGFEVEPHLQGETVRLAIAPRLAFASSRGAQAVGFQELSTTVTVKLGEWVDLGGMVESANEVNRQILATRRRHSDETSRFLIRVDAP